MMQTIWDLNRLEIAHFADQTCTDHEGSLVLNLTPLLGEKQLP